MKTTKNILILGSGGNAGINFVKSLQHEQKTNPKTSIWNLFGTDTDEYFINLACCPSFIINRSTKEKQIDDLINEHNIHFIHAQPDAEVQFILSNPKYKDLIFPHTLDKWKVFGNKLHCQLIWKQDLNLGFQVAGFANFKKEDFYKFTQKTGKAWVRASTGAGSKAALPVTTYEQAANWIEYWVENKKMNYEDFVISEFLPGREFAVQTFWVNGVLVHSQARERLKYVFQNIMPSGQSSTPSLARTVNEQRVYDTATASILAIDKTPHGIYCVDIKANAHDALIPTEVNYGRFFTTSIFFSMLGVNTPAEYTNYFFTKKYNVKINTIEPDYYCIRGLDCVPVIKKF